jgi:phage/plasmid-associated DNA primase
MSEKAPGAEPSEPAPTTDVQQAATLSETDGDGDFTDGFADQPDESIIGKSFEPDSGGESNQTTHTDESDNDEQTRPDSEADGSSSLTRRRVFTRLSALLSTHDGEVNRDHVVLDIANSLDVDTDDERLNEFVNELSDVDDSGTIVGVDASGLPTTTQGEQTWVSVNNTFGAEHGKGCLYRTQSEKRGAARGEIVDILEDEGWIAYKSMETGEDDLYYYDVDTGRYIRDDEDVRLERILEQNIQDKYYSQPEVREIKGKLKARVSAGYDDVNARHLDGIYVNTKNYVLRIDPDATDDGWRWEVHEHSPEYRFISQSVDNAEYYFADPENVELDMLGAVEWLRSMFKREDKAKVVCEVFGASLRPDQYFKAFAMFTGPTNSGKTTTLNAWRGTLGYDNTQGIEFHELAEGKFESSELFARGGLMMNTGSDIEKRKLDKTSTLKKLTSNDYTYHDVKHDSGFSGISTALQVHVANNAPVMDPDDGAVPARLKHIHFPMQFWSKYSSKFDEDDAYIAEADPDLEADLKSDGIRNALLVLALRGLHRLYENDKTFSFEAGSDERWATYNARADTIARFAMDSLTNSSATNEDGLDVYLTTDEVNEMWKSWASKHGKGGRSDDSIHSLLKQVSFLEVYQQRTRRTSDDEDRVQVFWRMRPAGEGWAHVPGDAKARMIEEFDLVPDQEEQPITIPGLEPDESSDSVEDVSDDANEILKAISSREMSDTREPTISGVIQQSGVSPQDAQVAIGEVLTAGKARIDGGCLRSQDSEDGVDEVDDSCQDVCEDADPGEESDEGRLSDLDETQRRVAMELGSRENLRIGDLPFIAEELGMSASELHDTVQELKELGAVRYGPDQSMVVEVSCDE